jgi:predicted transcriptional regulator
MYSSDPRALEWAEKLFQYYRDRAVLLEFKEQALLPKE